MVISRKRVLIHDAPRFAYAHASLTGPFVTPHLQAYHSVTLLKLLVSEISGVSFRYRRSNRGPSITILTGHRAYSVQCAENLIHTRVSCCAYTRVAMEIRGVAMFIRI